MESTRQLTARRAQILDQIAAMGPMRMGSICEQMLPHKQPDGTIRRRGPYLTYTFKQGGKTHGKHLRNPQEAALYQRQIDNYRRYQDLSAQLVQVCQRMADLEASAAEDQKKTSRR
jgi:hypothetical protein